MRHIKTTSKAVGIPEKAMSTADILTIVGSIMAGVGGVLLGIAPYFGSKSLPVPDGE